MSDLMACATCSAPISAEASFCGECGTPVQQAEAVPLPEAVPAFETAPFTEAVPVFAAPEAPAAPPVPPAPPVIIRRGLNGPRLLPREAAVPEGGVTVSRNVLGARATVKTKTSRERKIAGDLPEWEPLPPGELLVRRGL